MRALITFYGSKADAKLSVKGRVDVYELYEDLVDTVKVLEAMRTDDPSKAISLDDFLKKHGRV